MSSHPSARPTWTSAGHLQAVLLGLASGGVCLAAASPRRRCALTAPFHPCRPAAQLWPRAWAVSFLWHFPAGFPGSVPRPPCPVMSGLSSRTGFLSGSRDCLTSPVKSRRAAARGPLLDRTGLPMLALPWDRLGRDRDPHDRAALQRP